MTHKPTPAASRAFLRPGGFARLETPPLSESARLRWLVGMFARLQLRSVTAKLMAASFPLTGLAAAALLALANLIPQLQELLGADRRVFVTDKIMPFLFGSNLVNVLLQTTIWVAPSVARDVQAGALLLYFSRPLRRRDYLWARVLAATAIVWFELAIAALVVIAGQIAAFGPALDGGTALGGWAFWLLLALGEVLVALGVAAAIATLALGCSAVARSVNGAPLLFAGVVLGSMPLAAVLASVSGGGALWHACDVSQALNAQHQLLMGLLSPQPFPDGLLARAALSALVLVGLGAGAWQLLARLLRQPPQGKGRA